MSCTAAHLRSRSLNIVSLSDIIEGSYRSWDLYTTSQLVDGLQQKRKPVFIKPNWNNVVFSRATILSFHLVYIYIYIYIYILSSRFDCTELPEILSLLLSIFMVHRSWLVFLEASGVLTYIYIYIYILVKSKSYLYVMFLLWSCFLSLWTFKIMAVFYVHHMVQRETLMSPGSWIWETDFQDFLTSLIIIFTNPSAQAGYDKRSIFKRSLTGLNSEFSFS